MNRSFIVAVLTVTMIVMMSTASYALVAPHQFACDNCHGKHLGTEALTINNGCVTCHNTSGEAPGKPMNPEAMSNYFGTSAGQPATGSKSSHNWLATAPFDPRANVHEPTNAALITSVNYTKDLTGTVGCLRCHNAKSTNVDKPFLRVTNVNDALCLDCHSARRTSTAATGSHPVDYRAYSTVYKLNTTAFRKITKNANPYNRTSNLGNYFSSNGRIVCSTCHAPHYADSSSATLDNRSTAKGFGVDEPAKGLKGTFQDSKGEMLRTDRYGATADAVNVCSSCHKETKNLNHNAKGQNIQCDHCHAAHVDYTGDGSAPNQYLVRRDFSNMSTLKVKLGPNKIAIYNTATSLRFMRADGKGICQVCHTPTPGVAIHDLTDTRKEDCMVCHKHSNGFSAAACTSCHGQPPVTSAVGGPDGKASASYTVDENFTPHATHADAAYYKYACKNCHYEGTPQANHNNGSFQSVFVETAGSVGATLGFKNVPSDYNTTTRTCSNVYCHSNGNPRKPFPATGNVIAWKSATTPGWEFGKNKIVGQASECTTCHEYGNTLVSNAHYAHVTSVGLKCYVCHNATVNMNGGIVDRTKHANGTKDIAFVTRPANFNGVFTAAFNNADASCTNSCHGSATPVWNNAATGQCGSCHAVPATSGAHTFHFTDTAGPQLGTAQTVCVTCHDNVGNGKHANGQIDVKGCTPCHPGTAVWTNAASVTCESCHTGTTASVVGTHTAPLKTLGAGHSQYSTASLSKVRCTSCHNASANHIGAGPTEKRLLLAGNALCASCHTTAANKGLPAARLDLSFHKFSKYSSTVQDKATIASVRADACAGCHDTHGSTNRMSIRTTINGLTVSYIGSTPNFIETTPGADGFYHGLCQVCHTKTTHFNRNSAPDTAHATGGCLSCHDHQHGFTPTFGSCNGCHGYPPVRLAITRQPGTIGTQGNYSGARFQDYSGGGGAHSVAGHIKQTLVPNEQWTNCSSCHYNTSHATGGTTVNKINVNVIVDPKYKFNNATSITYNANSCSNVSCHFKPTPNWVTGN